MNKYFLSFLFLFSLEIISEDIISINIGEEWFLDSRSNKLSPTNSKVLYFMPNDAYHTYRARQFGDWDVFSIVDDRNLERLNKDDVIQIVEPSFNEKIYKVKLMNGSSKNKDFFIITEDLIKYYKPLKEQNNE
ncbi:hypothetical protein N9C99_00675 [Gammaproteobacteria bacterium]|nr:hypothetical protein [Gammaproteobacteria bacterium]